MTDLSKISTHELAAELFGRYVEPLRGTDVYDIAGDAAVEFVCSSGHTIDDTDDHGDRVDETITTLLFVVAAKSSYLRCAMLAYKMPPEQ